MRSLPAVLLALAGAAHCAHAIDMVAVMVNAFPNPDSVVKLDVLDPIGPIQPFADLPGMFVRGLDMDTPVSGWFVVTSGASGFYRLEHGISTWIAPLPATSVNIGGLSLSKDKSYLYYCIGGGTSGPVMLYRIDFDGTFTFLGEVTGIGPSAGRLGGLAVHPASGILYGLDMPNDALYTIDTATAAATRVGLGLGFSVSNLVGGLDFTQDGRLFMASNFGEIREIDPQTGVAGPVLRSLFAGVSSLAALPVDAPPCYANCDGSTTEPILNVEDFICFVNEFASALALPPAQQVTHYANCDGSTTEPVLNVEDFTCFVSAFAQGCP
jgi:hypothetical protein